MGETNDPLVSIGLPVYNAENYIRQAIDSILAQRFKDFELIILDNASTDNTEKFCRTYAKKDKRINYFRNENNIGAARNFNKVFSLSKGEFFKWMAHDDLLAPDFLEKAVKALETEQSAALCHAKAKIIDEDGKFKNFYKVNLRLHSSRPRVRFHDLALIGHRTYPIFGLIRSELLKKTPLIGSYATSDKILLARLALIGRFHELKDSSLIFRDHPKQSMKIPDKYSYAVWFDPKNKRKLLFPHWRIFYEYLISVKKARINLYNKTVCYFYMGVWIVGWWKGLLRDLTFALSRIIKR